MIGRGVADWGVEKLERRCNQKEEEEVEKEEEERMEEEKQE